MAPSISLYYNQTMLYSWKNLLTLHVICVKTIWPMSDLKQSPENSRNEDFKKVWHCFLAWIVPELQTFLWRSLFRGKSIDFGHDLGQHYLTYEWFIASIYIFRCSITCQSIIYIVCLFVLFFNGRYFCFIHSKLFF